MKICLCQPVLNSYDPPISTFYEVLTHGLSIFAKMAAVKYNLDVVELTYNAATYRNLEAALKDADIFVFAGHSDPAGEILAGHDKATCMDLSRMHLLKGIKVYLICCYAARSLGPAAVDEGAQFCLAFDDKVYLMARKQEPIIARCLIQGLLSIIRCDEAAIVFRNVINKHKFWIEKILENYAEDEEWLLAACALDWNMEHFNVVTKDGVLKGESMMPKLTNPTKLSDAQIEVGLARLRRKVAQMKPLDAAPGLVTGGAEDLSPAEILRILEKRKAENDWGHDDIPEKYLVQLAKNAC